MIIEFGSKIGLKAQGVIRILEEFKRAFKKQKIQEMLNPKRREEQNDFCNKYKAIIDVSFMRILQE